MTNKDIQKELAGLFNLEKTKVKVFFECMTGNTEQYNFTLDQPSVYSKGRAVINSQTLLSVNITERILL